MELLHKILPHWVFRQTDKPPKESPCATIVQESLGQFYCTTIAQPDASKAKRWDSINVICELIVELAWEQIRSNPSWLCLHCGAVEFNGRLVLFPNRKKAGKSTLVSVLASRNYKIFTDDFLLVKIDNNGIISGISSGIEPRIRLPLPSSFSSRFKDWVSQNVGPENTKYKYLSTDNLADQGEVLPIGAIVTLNRNNDFGTKLSASSREVALNNLITQNFARTLHSGRILRASNWVSETSDLYEIQFSCAESAADALEKRFQAWPTPIKPIKNPHSLPQECVNLSLLSEPVRALGEGIRYMRTQGVNSVLTDQFLYLSDASGLGIHKLNSGSAMIWSLLKDPSSLAEVVAIIKIAFPDVQTGTIEKDALGVMTQLVQNRLITSCSNVEMVQNE
jgi:hypothetical protein